MLTISDIEIKLSEKKKKKKKKKRKIFFNVFNRSLQNFLYIYNSAIKSQNNYIRLKKVKVRDRLWVELKLLHNLQLS